MNKCNSVSLHMLPVGTGRIPQNVDPRIISVIQHTVAASAKNICYIISAYFVAASNIFCSVHITYKCMHLGPPIMVTIKHHD